MKKNSDVQVDDFSEVEAIARDFIDHVSKRQGIVEKDPEGSLGLIVFDYLHDFVSDSEWSCWVLDGDYYVLTERVAEKLREIGYRVIDVM